MFFSAKRIRKCKVEWQEMLRLERQYYSLSKRSPSVSTPTQTVQDVDASPSVRPPATSSPSAVPTTLAASSSSSSSSPPYASKAYYKMCAVRWKDYRRTGLAAFGIDIKSSESSTTKELITASSTCIVDLSSTSAPTSDSNSDDTPLKSSNSKKAAISPLDLYPPSDDEKDVELVFKQLPPPPKSLSDLLEVKTSSMENAGNGCFAKRYIPLHTLIGFYFGVPMSEDEFDLLKENVGIASQYTIRYKRTVLDATDDQGQPFAPNNPHFFCPMHFINESVHQVNVVFTEGPIVNQIWAVTIRDIEEGEELFTKYGDEIDRTSWTSG